MMLRPFFPFYGSKWRGAMKYPPPRYPTVVEPFAGSAGYSTRHHWARVVLVERDPVIAAVWRYLIRADPRRLLALPDVTTTTGALDVEPAERALIGLWLNPGNAYPANVPSTWARDYPHRVWGPRARARLADQVLAIRHWTVIEGEWHEGPGGEATRFVDPPYVVQGKHYRHGPGGIDYEALARACRSWPGQVIACENVGATWLPFAPHATTKAVNGWSSEAVWLGGVEA